MGRAVQVQPRSTCTTQNKPQIKPWVVGMNIQARPQVCQNHNRNCIFLLSSSLFTISVFCPIVENKTWLVQRLGFKLS